MKFEFVADIHRPVEEVFAFFRDVERHAAREGSRVPVYDKLTPGPTGPGTRYREVVRVLPGVHGEVLTEVTGLEPGRRLAYRYVALGMAGELTYHFEAIASGTRVLQQQSLQPKGWLRLFGPLIGVLFSRVAGRRLMGIKALLEGALTE